MRRFCLAMLIILLLLPATGITHAQDNQLIFADLNETYAVSDLAFAFNYPSGWVFDTTSGIVLAENAVDLAAELDNDQSTNASGYTIALFAATADSLGLSDPSLDNVVTAVTGAGGLAVSQKIETPFMTRRALTVLGVDAAGAAGVATIWLQDGLVVVFGMGVPGQEVSVDEAYSWFNIILSCVPLTNIVLDASLTLNRLDGFTIAYPKSWTVGDDPALGGYFFENSDDAGISLNSNGNRTEPLKGNGIIINQFELTSVNLNAQNTPDDVMELLIQAKIILDPINRSELVLFGQPALSVEYVGQNGANVIAVTGIVGENVYLIIAASPTPQMVAAFKPLFVSILMSITPLQ